MKRWIPLLLAITAYFVISLIWIARGDGAGHEVFAPYSSENRSYDGLSLARSYLAHQGGRTVRALNVPLAPESVPSQAVVFRVSETFMTAEDDSDEPKPKDEKSKQPGKKTTTPSAEKAGKPSAKKATKPSRPLAESLLDSDEEEWVRRGGRLVVAIAYDQGPLGVKSVRSRTARKVFPAWPGIDTLALPVGRVLEGAEALRRTHALYVIDEPSGSAASPAPGSAANSVPGSTPNGTPNSALVIVRMPIGSGDLIVMATPEALANARLDAQNLALLSALAGHDRPVYFDETVHGMIAEQGMIAMLLSWRLGPFLLLALLAAALACWRAGRRVGQPEDDYRDTRSEAVDLVSSLGALYDRTMTSGGAIASYHHELTRAVAAQSGLRGEPLHRRVAALTNDMRVPGKDEKLDPAELALMLGTVNDGFRKLER